MANSVRNNVNLLKNAPKKVKDSRIIDSEMESKSEDA